MDADEPMENPSDRELAQFLLEYLGERQDQMLSLLETLVQAESPTDVPEAQGKVQDVLSRLFQKLDFEVMYLPEGAKSGGHLFVRPMQPKKGRPLQLLLGHCDTVWPIGTLQKMPFVVEDDVARGPGVFDMKGGLVQMIFAFAALRAAEVDPPVFPIAFINSDEEQGSPTSQRHIRRLARCADRVFVLEPALGLDGKLKTRRKGAGRFTVRIQGKSAHAGLDPESGSSAILELSHVVQRLHELNDTAAGITVNVGTIDGGTRPNVIADESFAEVDVRINTAEQAEFIEQALRKIEATTAGTSLKIEGGIGRYPMEPSPGGRRLWKQAQYVASCLDIELQEGRSGGVSDGNITSQYAPTLDGLGPVGDGAHARHEFCYVGKMIERSALLSLLMAQPLLTDLTESEAESSLASSPTQNELS